MRIRSILITALAAGLLAGCHRESPESVPENDQVANFDNAADANNEVEAAPEANLAEANMMDVEPPKPKKPKAWPAPAISADQQTLDDADATGMTARVSPDGSGPDSGGGNSN